MKLPRVSRRALLRGAAGLVVLAPGPLRAADERSWSIERFGARPGRGTEAAGPDCTEAIHAAMNALVEESGGGTVWVPPGVWWHRGIKMRSRIRLAGAGWQSILKLLPGANAHCIRHGERTNRRGESIDQAYQLDGLTINGNRSAQTEWVDGVHFRTSTDAGEYFANKDNVLRLADPMFRLSNLLIQDCKRDGIHVVGRGESMFTDIVVGACTRHGVVAAMTDSSWKGIEVGGVGADGFQVRQGTQRFVACKAFFCGQDTAVFHGPKAGVPGPSTREVAADDWRRGCGWYLADGYPAAQMAACEAQDTWGHGFVVEGSSNIMDIWGGNIGALYPRHGFGSPNVPSDPSFVVLGPEARSNHIRGVQFDQHVAWHRQKPVTRHLLQLADGARDNVVDLIGTRGHFLGPVTNAASRAAEANRITLTGG